MVPACPQPPCDVSQPRDFTRVLPPRLSMSILGLLDPKSLDVCCAVSGRWEFLVGQLREEQECRSTVQKNLLQMKELCPRKTIPNYAKRVEVPIPQLNDEGEVVGADKEQNKRRKSKSEDLSLHAAYKDLKTHKIELEERNVFCGPFRTHVLLEHSDRTRRIHFGGGDWVAVASANRKVRLLRVPGGKEEPLLLQGQAGPIQTLCLQKEKGLLLCSTSFDFSIRCWNIHSGVCVRTFVGHYGPISCLHSHQEHFVSGAGDGMLKVWSLQSGKCLRTLVHKSPVWAVRMDRTHVVSGCHRGLVKVWSVDTGLLLKTLEGHQGPVLCLSFDQWHLVTGSRDGYALGWSMQGKFRRCLIAFFHPKEVLSLELLYLRVISGCADGLIRIFSFLTGSCLRVLEPSSSGDPLSALCVAGNRMVTNSPRRLVLLQFQDVLWDYSLPAERELKEKSRRGKPQGASAERRAQDKSPKSRQPPRSRGRPKSDEAEQGPAPEEAEATLEPPERDPNRPMSPDKFLLTLSALQSSSRPAPGSPGAELSAHAREAQQHPGKVWMSKTSLRHKEEQAAQLQRAQLHSDSLSMAKTSVPFETKTLQLRLENSLHSPAVKSSIPAPCVVHPKFRGSLGGRKTSSGHRKGPRDGEQLMDLSTACSELKQPAPGTAALTSSEAPRGMKPLCPHRDSVFRLLTAEQEEREAAVAAQQQAQQAQQAQPTEDQGRARRKAWLRKMKGLPVDSFTGERKTPAPELGQNTFI